MRLWPFALILAAVVAVFYRTVIGYDFVEWDDASNVTDNPLLQEPWSWELAARFFDPERAMRFKPLHWVMFRVLAGGAGMDPALWHTAGLALHVACAVLFFLALAKVMRRVFAEVDDSTLVPFSWLGAAIWALHPLRVEPVAWVTASTYAMVGVFLTASFWAYMRAYDHGIANLRWLGVSWVLALGAYGTYPVGVTYGFWLIAADVCILRIAPDGLWKWSDGSVRRWWGKHAMFMLPAALAVVFTLWTRYGASGTFGEAPTLNETGWDERLLVCMASLAIFPAKLFWPADLHPNHMPIQGGAWLSGWAPVYAAISGCVWLWAWVVRKRRRAFIWFCAGFTGLALPCLGLTERPIWPVDRYSYVIDMVLVGVVAAGAVAWASRSRGKWPARVAMTLACAGGMWGSYRLLPIWKNTDALFSHIEQRRDFDVHFKQASHVYKLWYLSLLKDGREGEAIEKLGRANEVYLSRIRGALKEGDLVEATELSWMLEGSIGITPGIRRERAGWLLRLGKTHAAMQDLRRVLYDAPGDERAQEMLLAAEKGATGTQQ